MKKRYLGAIVVILTMAVGVAGALMRWYLSGSVLDADGLLPAGNHFPLIMGIVLALGLAVVAILARRLEPRPEFARNFCAAPNWFLYGAFTAVAIAITCGLQLKDAGGTMRTLAYVFGVLGGASLVAYAALQAKGHKPAFLLLLPLCVFLALNLIGDYQQWSADPMLLDYCFVLLADAACLLAVFNVGGFSFDRGKRRMTVFWCCCGIVFSLVSVVDSFVSEAYFSAAYRLAITLLLMLVQLQLCDVIPQNTGTPQESAE